MKQDLKTQELLWKLIFLMAVILENGARNIYFFKEIGN